MQGASWASENESEDEAAGDAGAASRRRSASPPAARRHDRGNRAGRAQQVRRSERVASQPPGPARGRQAAAGAAPAAVAVVAAPRRRGAATTAPVAGAMSTLLLTKLFEVHKECLALKPDDRTAWHKERMNAGQTHLLSTVTAAPSASIDLFFQILELVDKIAANLAAARLVNDHEDVAELRTCAPFGDDALNVVRTAFASAPASTASVCRTCAALELVLLAYLPPRAAHAWRCLRDSWTWPDSFEAAFAQAVRLQERRNVIAKLTSAGPVVKRLSPWGLSDLVGFLEHRGPPWVAQALHASTATDLAGLKTAMSAHDPGSEALFGSISALRPRPPLVCYHCGQHGHKANDCQRRQAGYPATDQTSISPRPAGQAFVSGQVSSDGSAPYVRPGVHALSEAYVFQLEADYERVQADARQLAAAYLQVSTAPPAPSRAQVDAQRADSTGEPVPRAQVLSGGLNTLAPWSSDESVPAAYVDWTRGPKFTEQPESTARAAFQQSVRQATFGLPPGDAPTAEELALHRQGVPMRTSPPWPHA